MNGGGAGPATGSQSGTSTQLGRAPRHDGPHGHEQPCCDTFCPFCLRESAFLMIIVARRLPSQKRAEHVFTMRFRKTKGGGSAGLLTTTFCIRSRSHHGPGLLHI